MKKGQGNVRKQRWRRRHYNEQVSEQKEYYELIDGSWSKRPYAWCEHYKAYLTVNLVRLHRCDHRNCGNFRVKFGRKEQQINGDDY